MARFCNINYNQFINNVGYLKTKSFFPIKFEVCTLLFNIKHLDILKRYQFDVWFYICHKRVKNKWMGINRNMFNPAWNWTKLYLWYNNWQSSSTTYIIFYYWHGWNATGPLMWEETGDNSWVFTADGFYGFCLFENS